MKVFEEQATSITMSIDKAIVAPLLPTDNRSIVDENSLIWSQIKRLIFLESSDTLNQWKAIQNENQFDDSVMPATLVTW